MDKNAKLLLVEDDLNLGFVIKDKLEASQYQVDWAPNGIDGLTKCLNNYYDLAILDVMLPKISGFDIAEKIVIEKPELPFLFLTAKSLLEDRLRGLKLGRDFISKPFEFEELLARIDNILSRENQTGNEFSEIKLFQIGEYEFDHTNQYLTRNDKVQKLTKREADVLKELCINLNQVMNRESALKKIWGNDDYFNGRSMDVFISRIRKYLKDDPRIQVLNIHGVGFKLAIK